MGNQETGSRTVTKSDASVVVGVGSAPNINLSNRSSYTIEGTCAPAGGGGSLLVVFPTPVNYSRGDLCTSSEGRWQATIPNIVLVGTNGSIDVSVTFTHNDESAGALTIPIAIDTQAPTVTLETPVEIGRINDAAYFLSGTCSEDGEEVGIVFTDSEATPNMISKTAYCVGTAWQRTDRCDGTTSGKCEH